MLFGITHNDIINKLGAGYSLRYDFKHFRIGTCSVAQSCPTVGDPIDCNLPIDCL